MDLETKFDLILKELKNICTQIDERFEKIDERFEKVEQRFEKIDEKFEILENKFDNLSKEVGASNRILLKLDVETNEKFETLFEATKKHTDKELIFEKQLCRLHDSLNDTTSRVSVLENNVVNL